MTCLKCDCVKCTNNKQTLNLIFDKSKEGCCSICFQIKPLNDIVKKHTYCKGCQVKRNKEYYENYIQNNKVKEKLKLKKDGKKKCTICNNIFDLEDMAKLGKSGKIASTCVPCYKEYCRKTALNQYERKKKEKNKQ